LRGDWQFANGDYRYWFKKITNVDDKLLEGKKVYKYSDNDKNKKFVFLDPIYSYTTINEKFGMPTEKYSSYDISWWKGQLLYFLMRPNKRLEGMITNEKMRLGLPEKFIGLQIRHSTTWKYNRRNTPLKEFMQCAVYAKDYTGIKNVFVSTENAKVIRNLKKYKGFKFFYTKNERSNLNQARAIMKGELDGVEEGRIAMLNLFLMREASVFICGFRSNWGRLVMEHMLATDNKPDVIISLDTPLVHKYPNDSLKLKEFSWYDNFYIKNQRQLSGLVNKIKLKKCLFFLK
jgi:hypothetical protein